MDMLWNHWLVIAFVAPFLWAVVNIIDVYFVESIYEDEYDGAMISGIFQIIPWLLVPLGLVSFQFPGAFAASLALLGGGAFLLSFFYYFRALFTMNDVSAIQVMWNMSVLLVPFFAWFIADERLDLVHYAAIVIAFFGAMLLSFDENLKAKNIAGMAKVMVPAVVLLSLSMAIEDRAYTAANGDFWSIFLLFSLGATVVALLLSLTDAKKSLDRLKHIGGLSRKYFAVFFMAESFSLVGTLTSQRAIDLSPAVSFVAVVESLTPAFVIVLSLFLSFSLFALNREKARAIYQEQTVGIGVKSLAIAVTAFAIYLVS